MGLNHKMGDSHEAHLAKVFGARRTRGSGSQWRDQTDARAHRMDESVAFAWDGKSTRARSATITRASLDKLVDQAGAERPVLAIRFYDDDRLRSFEDWDLIREDDLRELLDRSRRLSALDAAIDRLFDGHDVQEVFPDEPLYDGELHALTAGLRKLT